MKYQLQFVAREYKKCNYEILNKNVVTERRFSIMPSIMLEIVASKFGRAELFFHVKYEIILSYIILKIMSFVM